MGVVGVQLVVSLVMASLMQRLTPHYSIGRWLICNGSLLRFRHPTDDELRALSGKQKPKMKRDSRRQNGVTEPKPETVPKDINLQLDTKPITTMDALVLRYFLEYQWLVDFVLYATLVYLFTEVYYCLVSAETEINVGVLWCLLTLVFAVKTLVTLMSHYFRTEDGGERSVCLTFAFLFLVIAMLVLVISEDYLEFGLEPGFDVFYENVSNFLRQQGIQLWPFSVCRLIFKLSLVGLCSFIGAFLTFPGLRLAQTQLDALKLTADRPLIQFLLHISFLSPVLVLLLWVKPVARNFVLNAPLGKEKLPLLSDSGYNTARLWAIMAVCAVRLAVTRYHLQAYLNLADKWVDQLKRETGHIAMIDIQRKVTRVFCYLCVVTLQYLGPIVLLLHSTLLLKVLGDYSWGVYPETPGITVVPEIVTAAGSDPSADEEEDYQATVSHITASLGALRNVLTPLFYRGLFSFLTWWLAACQTIISLFGLYFHQYLMAS
ncbi:transmembrane protein 161A isoform X1 [Callorhinchus milii]|uniref:transmembrane protein 161A isoform X1 n=1 Tax=Callorhinchus milii TaxID=7868 RepID=UPI001C3FE6F8|nr:transmembrane protein 161A isoform X1 [Callorhinchus milii]